MDHVLDDVMTTLALTTVDQAPTLSLILLLIVQPAPLAGIEADGQPACRTADAAGSALPATAADLAASVRDATIMSLLCGELPRSPPPSPTPQQHWLDSAPPSPSPDCGGNEVVQATPDSQVGLVSIERSSTRGANSLWCHGPVSSSELSLTQ